MYPISRRHADYGSIQAEDPGTGSNSNRPVGLSGIHHQPGEKYSETDPQHRFSGLMRPR